LSKRAAATAVAQAMAETLNRSAIDAEFVAERDLDPTQLTGHLLESHPFAIQHFSAAEVALYQRIISESGHYIIDIASVFPVSLLLPYDSSPRQ
jgi:hypothetical protein